VPAWPLFRQPYYNELLLRDAGLFSQGRTTPPTTLAEFADVSKRVARPDERWGSLLPSQAADEELYLHVLQHVHAAGGEPPRRDGTRVRLDTPPMREALGYLLDLVQKSGALPLDRPPFRLAETGRAGLWWADSSWLGDQAAVGATLRVGAAPAPRGARGGAIVRGRHWCLGGLGGAREEASALLAYLAEDEASHRYCAGLSLPPARRANWARPAYTEVADRTRPWEPSVWRATIEQLGSAENLPLVTFARYREVAGRVAGEMQLVLLGKKPIANALAEGEAAVAELLARA
jgi:ABC-type glycerol-3-phosphate transport system substrate-binding protein